MKKLYSIAFLLVITISLKAQTYAWTNTFGGSSNSDFAYSVEVDAAGNVYIAGTCYNPSVDFDPSSGTYLLIPPPDRQLIAFIAKYNSDGDLIWARNTGQHIVYAMDIDPNSNIFIAGYYEDSTDLDPTSGTNFLYGHNNNDIYLIKYDSAGNFLWGHGMGSNGEDEVKDVKADEAGNAYIVGLFSNSVDFDPSTSTNTLTSYGSVDGFLAKYAPDGTNLWAVNMGGTGFDLSMTLTVSPSDTIYVGGSFVSMADFDPTVGVASLSSTGSADIFIAKYTSAGVYKNAFNLGGTTGENISSIYSNNSSIFITGGFGGTIDFDPGSGSTTFTAPSVNDNLFFGKYNSVGDFVWVKAMGSTVSDDQAQSLAFSPTGDIYVTGWFTGTVDFNPTTAVDNHTSSGLHDIFLTKYADPSTDVLFNQISYTYSLIIYPNPNTGSLFCETTENTQLNIYNSSGALVFKQVLNMGKSALDISSLVPGVYLVRSSQSPQGMILIKQ